MQRTSYSNLQRKQLSKQAYTDTQSTYLLVYAPGRLNETSWRRADPRCGRVLVSEDVNASLPP